MLRFQHEDPDCNASYQIGHIEKRIKEYYQILALFFYYLATFFENALLNIELKKQLQITIWKLFKVTNLD